MHALGEGLLFAAGRFVLLCAGDGKLFLDAIHLRCVEIVEPVEHRGKETAVKREIFCEDRIRLI